MQPPILVPQGRRLSGDLYSVGSTNARPLCFVRAADLMHEVALIDPEAADGARANPGFRGDETQRRLLAATRQVLEKQRDGSHWFPFTQGLSPRDHLEQRNLAQLEQRQRQHDLTLAQMQKDAIDRATEFQKTQVTITESLASIADRTDRFTALWTRVAVALALGALLVVLAAYVFPDAGRHLGEWLLPGIQGPPPTP